VTTQAKIKLGPGMPLEKCFRLLKRRTADVLSEYRARQAFVPAGERRKAKGLDRNEPCGDEHER
jgi:ribosomal protein S21